MRIEIEPRTEAAALRDAFGAFFDKESPTTVVRSAEPLGFAPELWEKARALGVPDMAIDADLGDLSMVALEAGRRLAPIPLVETVVAARLLEAAGGCPADVARGERLTTIALRPAVGGEARLVPAGAIAHQVIALDGDELVLHAGAPGALVPNLGAAPLADRPLDGERVVLATDRVAHDLHAVALDEWRVLMSAMLVGVARGALGLAVEYAKSRHQFGVPIGSFQSLQHQLADAATELEGADLLAWRAATDLPRRGPLSLMSWWFATRASRRAAELSLHVHGGYGFMLEQDVQLFVRRAAAWSLTLGDPAATLGALADALAEHGWLMEDAVASGFRSEVRAFLEENCTPDVIERAHESGTMHDWGLHRALGEKGWLAAEWPRERGGQERDPWEMLELGDELARAGAPTHGLGTSSLVAHVLEEVGTEQQRHDIVPALLRGDAICCLGYSEPDAGSDVAAARTRATRDGDDWIINGQKMFTTLAHESAYVFLLTRTNPDAPKHRGLTMFIVPMDTPGIEVTPIETVGGEGTNVTFYTDVRVPDSCRVGDVDGGWQVMTVALAYERNPLMVGTLDRLVRRFVAWAEGRAGVLDRPEVRARLAAIVTELEVGRLLGLRMAAVSARGELPTVEGSMAKLFSSEVLVRSTATLLDVLGAEAVRQHGDPEAPVAGWIEHAYRDAQVETIRAGTSEIQRSIIAERGLGLPRGR